MPVFWIHGASGRLVLRVGKRRDRRRTSVSVLDDVLIDLIGNEHVAFLVNAQTVGISKAGQRLRKLALRVRINENLELATVRHVEQTRLLRRLRILRG